MDCPAKRCSAREPGDEAVANERRNFDADVAPEPHPWDDFLTGPENELALAAAQALARGEREGFSPLVVHGPSGVGKSRLLAGLVVERLRRQPGSAVAHLDAQAFSIACSEAADVADGSTWPALRNRFRSVDLFVLEDLEGLGKSTLARDELTHTLDALDAAGASVAVSAQTAPGTWSHLEWPVRLINRLLGGLAARIEPATLASLRRYVLHIAGRHGVALEVDAVETLIQAADGYRTLDGWIARLALEARIERGQTGKRRRHAEIASKSRESDPAGPTPRILDPHTVATILGEETHLAKRPVTIDTIARAVAVKFGVRPGALRGPSRRASVVTARHLAIHLARTLTGSSLAVIGDYFGGRDPATIRHACKSAAQRLNADPALVAAISSLKLSR